jgi:phenylalanyl-tRNA synthetase alpha chain
MDLKEIIQSLHPLERKVISLVEEGMLFSDLEQKSGMGQVEIMKALQMLSAKEILQFEALTSEKVILTQEGKKYLNDGLPEIKAALAISDGAKTVPEIIKRSGLTSQEIGKSLGVLRSHNFLNSGTDGFSLTIPVDKIKKKIGHKDYLMSPLLDSPLTNDFIKRKIVKVIVKKNWKINLTNLAKLLQKEDLSGSEMVENLTPEIIRERSWQGKQFRKYDVHISVPVQAIGRRHPMMESNNILRDVFIEMGFKEMEGPIVESEFWCFDALWIPQDHPARDEQDTFFLEGDAVIPIDYAKKVKIMHEQGIKKSHTPEGNFSFDITKRRILRTHSTATSFRYLRMLGERLQKGKTINGKYFYCAHNFRNEAMDATHLAEFFQAEGFIIANELSLADLMGFVKEYYSKLGINTIRFKPTFNPYTEPSMEAHYFDAKMNKWYALINSGIFRRETLEPFGLGEKRIIAWGMGASRVATLLTGANSMRDITGATCDFEWLRARPNMTRNIVRK